MGPTVMLVEPDAEAGAAEKATPARARPAKRARRIDVPYVALIVYVTVLVCDVTPAASVAMIWYVSVSTFA